MSTRLENLQTLLFAVKGRIEKLPVVPFSGALYGIKSQSIGEIPMSIGAELVDAFCDEGENRSKLAILCPSPFLGIDYFGISLRTSSKNQAKHLRTRVRKWLEAEIEAEQARNVLKAHESTAESNADRAEMQAELSEYGKEVQKRREKAQRDIDNLKIDVESWQKATKIGHEYWKEALVEVIELEAKIKHMEIGRDLMSQKLKKVIGERNEAQANEKRINEKLSKLSGQYGHLVNEHSGLKQKAEAMQNELDATKAVNSQLKEALANMTRLRDEAKKAEIRLPKAGDVKVGDWVWFIFDGMKINSHVSSINPVGTVVIDYPSSFGKKGTFITHKSHFGKSWGFAD